MNLVVIAVYGDWHPDCKPGHVLVHATVDGELSRAAQRRRFLIMAEEYYSATIRPVVIDPARHKEVL